MDRVRFGRVLGKGARLAARTAWEAVDAATAAAPVSEQQSDRQSPFARPEERTPLPRRAPRVPTITIPPGLAPAARSGFINPLKKASRALWYELTGSFFALFAFAFATGAWRTRSGLGSGSAADRNRLAAFCILALLFLYFSVSSFVRARRRNNG